MGNHRPYRDKERQKAEHFPCILRVFLRDLRAFAVAFLNFTSA
jgi:hypothetical protein